MLGYCLHGLCTFSNLVISENIGRKSEKEKKRIDMMWTVIGNVAADMICAHFQI